MNAERQQLSLALALSTGVNLLLVLIIVWAMAVSQGLKRNAGTLFPPPSFPGNQPPPDEVLVLISPEPAVEEKTPRTFINSPDGQADLSPTDAATRFISSQNLRAATETDAHPDGVAGLATQDGVDKPFLDLRNTEFRDGEQEAERPPETALQRPQDSSQTEASPPNPDASRDQPPNLPATSLEKPLDTPPEPAPPLTKEPPDSSNLSPAEPTSAPSGEAPTAENTPATIAFRDQQSANLIPLPPSPAKRAVRQAPAPPPLTRIPDRVPEATYSPGLRKARTLGTISNKGRSSVDAVATAEGRFGKSLRAAIEKTWRRRMLNLSGLANPGLVEVEFEVDAKGRISNVKLANPGEANPVMQDCALSAVIEAKLPPPPPELLEELRDSLTGSRMRCSFSFLIY